LKNPQVANFPQKDDWKKEESLFVVHNGSEKNFL